MEPQRPKPLDHPVFMAVMQFVKVEHYDRDRGHKDPRFRFEWLPDTPPDIERSALEIEVACAKCGRPIRPFRRRKDTAPGRGHLYLAVSCPLDVRIGCSRSKVASRAYDEIYTALGYKRGKHE